jgi:hypothetical protein
MFTVEDLVTVINGNSETYACSEIFSSKNKVSFKKEDAIELFPELASVSNENVLYAPVVLCSSLPVINKRRRCFTKDTMKRSAGGITDNLVNFEHNTEDQQMFFDRTTKDEICGHLRGSRFIDKFNGAEYASLVALSVLYLRNKGIMEMSKKFNQSNPEWYVSMECAHDIRKSEFLYRGDFIPIKEAPNGMRECVGIDSIKNYKGHELSLVLGGSNGSVNFRGMALTSNPADETSNILSMFTATPPYMSNEAANFSIPINLREKSRNGKNPELIHDNIMHEIASIKVIGKTSESDGHYHEVLSNGKILPKNGHTHYTDSFIITQGKKPTYTAYLGEHNEPIYNTDNNYTNRYRSHTHIVEIDLKNEYTNESSDTNNIIKEVSSGKSIIFNLSNEEKERMDELLTKLEELSKRFAEIGSTSKDKEIIDLAKSISKTVIENSIASETEKEIKERKKKGEFLGKEEVDKMIQDAVTAKEKEINERIELERSNAEKMENRRKSIEELGIKIDDVIDGDGDSKVTFSDIIKSIPLDDDGERMFDLNVKTWKKLKGVKKEETVNTAEAASVGNGKGHSNRASNPLLIAGAGPSSTGHSNVNTEGNQPKQKLGKHAVSI